MELDYNDAFGFRIIDDIDDFKELDEFEYPSIKRSHRRERSKKVSRTGKDNRIDTIKEVYARVQKLCSDELKVLRSIPRFQKKISTGKNWTLSEDLIILTFPGERKELALRLQRSPESIRKRLAVLREYDLFCKT
ncbi:MAG: hypothetical protein JRG73_16220 [Deltaproteobacteria bacterium]|nr:hypothetical protein [Deltaproteobacteria bacterium]MBW2308472.1 hypothetical protein [Deltaproteobacteria bacterium]